MLPRRKEPLYRKVNTRTHGVRHGQGGEARWARNTKAGPDGKMHAGLRHGLDYTPLFRFLQAKVGQDWDAVYAEVVARLDRPDPIFWMVALRPEDARDVVRTGESTYWSGLTVDAENRLVRVDPQRTVDDMEPGCACCTHTFNGMRFTRRYRPPEP